jgi:hypothetical protein
MALVKLLFTRAMLGITGCKRGGVFMTRIVALLAHSPGEPITRLMPLLNENATIVEEREGTALLIGPYAYPIVCLLTTVVSASGECSEGEVALYRQADLMQTDLERHSLALYRFDERTVTLAGFVTLQERDVAYLRRCGVLVRIYGVDGSTPGTGSAAFTALTLPQGTRVEEVADANREGDTPAVYAALTPPPGNCEIHYTLAQVAAAQEGEGG